MVIIYSIYCFLLILYYIIYIYIYINYIILLYIICFMLWSDNLLFFKKKLLYVYNDVYDNKHFLHIMHMPVRVHVSRTFPVLN